MSAEKFPKRIYGGTMEYKNKKIIHLLLAALVWGTIPYMAAAEGTEAQITEKTVVADGKKNKQHGNEAHGFCSTGKGGNFCGKHGGFPGRSR